MQGITPFLWFDDNAEEAANFYTSVFEDSQILNLVRYGEAGPGPAGSVMVVSFQLHSQQFDAVNGGPVYSFTPATSFFVSCASTREVDALWAQLLAGGTALMELGAYPFSPRFGWLQDKFGISWQIGLEERKQKIAPFLMFTGKQHGRAEEAIRYYTSLIDRSTIEEIVRNGPGEEEPEGTVKRAVFTLDGLEMMAMDSAYPHGFTFTPAVSFVANCDSQAEIDELWDTLGDGGEIQQCGWLTDRFGVTWQIVPVILATLMQDPDPARARRVTEAMLQMVKLDIAALENA